MLSILAVLPAVRRRGVSVTAPRRRKPLRPPSRACVAGTWGFGIPVGPLLREPDGVRWP